MSIVFPSQLADVLTWHCDYYLSLPAGRPPYLALCLLSFPPSWQTTLPGTVSIVFPSQLADVLTWHCDYYLSLPAGRRVYLALGTVAEAGDLGPFACACLALLHNVVGHRFTTIILWRLPGQGHRFTVHFCGFYGARGRLWLV